MWLNRTSAPAENPVTTGEAKAHLRVTHSGDDVYIGALIDAATQLLDGRHGFLGRCLVTQSWEYRIDAFPCAGVIKLPMPPLQSVASVKYIDPDGAEQTLDTGDYVVDAETYEGQIRLAYDKSWPSTRCEENAVRIVLTAGFGDVSAVPQPVKQALLMMIGHWYAHREAVSDVNLNEVPLAAKWLLGPYRLQGF